MVPISETLPISGPFFLSTIDITWELHSSWPECTLKLRHLFRISHIRKLWHCVPEICRCHLGRWSSLLCSHGLVSFFLIDVVPPGAQPSLDFWRCFACSAFCKFTRCIKFARWTVFPSFFRLTDDFGHGFYFRPKLEVSAVLPILCLRRLRLVESP